MCSDIWTTFVLAYKQESGNPNDPFAVVINRGSKVVGHVPRNVCSMLVASAAWGDYLQ